MDNIRDMTSGNPRKLILRFSIPLLIGNMCQQLYSIVDAMVVGNVEGVYALAAVGSAGWLDWLVLGIVMGMTQGFSILISQRFGAGDREGLERAVAMSGLLSLAMVVLAVIVALTCAYPLLRALDTPDDIIDMAYMYIRIIFAGIPVIVAYNLFAGILRALGDSKTPLKAMIIASIINIGLDILFVARFGWGVEGVAYATVIAQACSCVYCFLAVRRISIIKIGARHFRPDRDTIGELLRLGAPLAFQNGIIAAGGLILQRVINGFGAIFVSGITAAHKLLGVMEMAGTAFASAVGTFSGQNYGAGKFARIRQGVNSGIKITVGLAAGLAALMIAFGRYVVLLFISDEPEIVGKVVDVAYPYLIVLSVFLFMLFLLLVYRSALQGMGDTITPMISGIIELAMRISMAYILTGLIGEYGVYIAEVSAWVGAAALLIPAYFRRIGRLDPVPRDEKPRAV